MSFEALNTLSTPHVPNVNHSVATAGHEGVASFAWREVQGHHVRRMSVEVLQQLSTLDIPQGTSAVATAGKDLLVAVWEYAA